MERERKGERVESSSRRKREREEREERGTCRKRISLSALSLRTVTSRVEAGREEVE